MKGLTQMLLAAAFFVAVAWAAREVQLMREKAQQERTIAELKNGHHTVREGARHVAEEVFVLQHLLFERSIVAESDMLRGRARLIDKPRRRASEKRRYARHLSPHQVQLMVEDRDGNVH